MAAGALHSDHINYLILRYLQEAGHENAAEALYRDWRRPYEHRDPETLPFAATVQRHELIAVVQEGLRHDELMSRVSDHGRRFRWTLERQEDGIENGGTGSRPTSGGWKKSRGNHMRAPDEFPAPAAKRQRRSEGSEGIHINGDTMDVDANSTADAEAEDDGETIASPALGSEVEVVEVPERYDSMDVATQTSAQNGTKTSTMYWKVDNPRAMILHSIWNPSASSANSKTLLTVGEELCRFYQVPQKTGNAKQITQIDDPNMPSNSVVTATAWRPDGSIATCAVDSVRELAGGGQKTEQILINHNRDHGSSILPPGLNLLSPAGIVICLRYSPDGRYLLALRTNLKRGFLQIWESPNGESSPTEPVAWRVYEHPVVDASWRDDDSFVVCGDSIIELSKLAIQERPENGLTAGTVQSQGLENLPLPNHPGEKKWDKIRIHNSNGIGALISSTDSRSMVLVRASDFHCLPDVPLPDGQLSGVAFSSQVFTASEKSHSLLAITFVEGFCTIYAVPAEIAQAEDSSSLRLEELTLEMPGGPALAVAWSPDGKYLAVGGTEQVRIWEADALNNALHQPEINGEEDKANPTRKQVQTAAVEPFSTWIPDATVWTPRRNGVANGTVTEREVLEPSLSWSADGESLAFAVERQIAVIRFRPALDGTTAATSPTVNGHAKPSP